MIVQTLYEAIYIKKTSKSPLIIKSHKNGWALVSIYEYLSESQRLALNIFTLNREVDTNSLSLKKISSNTNATAFALLAQLTHLNLIRAVGGKYSLTGYGHNLIKSKFCQRNQRIL